MRFKLFTLFLVVAAAAAAWQCRGGNKEGWCSGWGWSFSVGDYQIVPSNLMLGLMAFGMLAVFVGLIKRRVFEPILKRSSIQVGSREALVTVVGYLLYLVAGLFGLSVAGITLTNLAIMAGALSVGIGFGLQNIVNNFVSGLILLFEQPVRPGDFVNIGGTEGFVRRIHIRSTEIETLDRISVIVPNSMLISEQVINWQLRDNVCRITVSVGVEYGSDTDKVRKLLIAAAEKNDKIIRGGPSAIVPGPVVQFVGFGDSSLDFELKVFIEDATLRHVVSSDLRFAVDASFRANDITIPFPQRDLWLKSVPEQIRARGIDNEAPIHRSTADQHTE